MGKFNQTQISIFLLKKVAQLPFWCIYAISGVMYLLVYYVFRYRKKTVKENLNYAFPEKDKREITRITRKYYRHLCDVALETVKMSRMTKADFAKRMVIKNPELPNRYFEMGESVVVLTMHYNNWEWSSCFGYFLKHHILGVYKSLHNAGFDKFMVEIREIPGNELVENTAVLRRLLKARKESEVVFTWLAADQTPPEYHKLWLNFLNRETIFYPGPAYISRKFNCPVLYQEIRKLSRGKYEMSFELLFENPENHSDNEIMETFIAKMETTIRTKPEYYLWSHKRWKHKRNDKF